MKKFLKLVLVLVVFSMTISSCSRVAPNYQGVLMEDYGKNGKADFKLVKGKVWTMGFGKELFQVPLYEQRAKFETPMHLKASNNTEFEATPNYSYSVIPERSIDVVFQNKHVSSGGEFMKAIEDNILEPKIYDITKELSRSYHTDSLMADKGQLKFEKDLESRVEKLFKEKGFELETFTCQLNFSQKVKAKIDTRNEVNTNISVLDQQIGEQKKILELETIKTQVSLMKSKGITDKTLQQDFIDKWDGSTAIYGSAPFFIKKAN